MARIQSPGLDSRKNVIWMHCASLGEFEQGRPIIENLKKREANIQIVVSFFSPSGFEVQKNYPGADLVIYLPADSKRNARVFISALNPKLVLWIKYDYWFFYLDELRQRKIPALLISANFQPGQPFFRWYGGLHRRMLGCFSQIFVQSKSSKHLLDRIGLSGRTLVSGDTRFDRVIEIAEGFTNLPLIKDFCGTDQVIVAGSTWEEDEEELDHYANSHPEIKFLIAPHEIDPAHLVDIENLFHKSIRLSVLEKMAAEGKRATEKSGNPTLLHGVPTENAKPNVLIIDTIGILSRLYAYATIAYVGGGFGDDGVHNVLEAAVYGKPVVFGPVIEKYEEAVDLVNCGGGLVIDSALEVEKVFDRLLSNTGEYQLSAAASAAYVHSKKGATEKVIRYIQENRLLTN